MEVEIIPIAVQWLVPAALGGVSGWLLKALRSARAKADRREQAEAAELAALKDASRSLLRCEIVRQHREHVIRGEPMRLEDREYIAKTYQSYHALGGNGMCTKLYEEIMELDLEA